MTWFKHDTDAIADGKIRQLLLEFGIKGYGVYFACVELIAHNLTTKNRCIQLPYSVEVLAHDLYIENEELRTILNKCITLGLFENGDDNSIQCPKLLKRVDESFRIAEWRKNQKSQDVTNKSQDVTNLYVPVTGKKEKEKENREEEIRKEREKTLSLFESLKKINPGLVATNRYVDSLARLQTTYSDGAIIAAYQAYHKKKPRNGLHFFCEDIAGWVPEKVVGPVCGECGCSSGHYPKCSQSQTRRYEDSPFPEA